MMEANKPQVSIPDQIISDMISNLSVLDCFDEATLSAIRQLASHGDLNKPNKIEQAIKTVEKQPHETD
jgi:hypothetical protein